MDEIKAAIFDVDGTLLDSMGIWEKSADIYLESIGKKSHEDLHTKLLSATIETASVYLKKEYEIDLSEKEIQMGIYEVVKDFYYHKAQLKKGALEFVKKLHDENVPMIICSSGIRELIDASMKRLDMLKYFSDVVTGDKTNFEVFNKCLELLNKKSDEVFIFEDGMHAIVTANKMGFKTVCVKDRQLNLSEIVSVSDYYMEDFVFVEKQNA